MRTNLEKFKYYMDLLNQKAQPFIDSKFPCGKPEKLFVLNGYSHIQECQITSIKYDFGWINEEKPTKADIEDVKTYLNSALEFTDDKIVLFYEYRIGDHKVSGAYRLNRILNEKHLAFTYDELTGELQRRKELYEPREGYIKCSYCWKQNPPENTVYDKLIFRDWDGRKQFVNEKELPYCKDKPCASHDQMAHEG